MNKRYIFIILLLGFVLIPKNTFAEDFSYQYIDFFENQDREFIKNRILNTSEEFKIHFEENYKDGNYFILGNPDNLKTPNNNNYTYLLVADSKYSYFRLSFSFVSIYYQLNPSNYSYYFDSDFNLVDTYFRESSSSVTFGRKFNGKTTFTNFLVYATKYQSGCINTYSHTYTFMNGDNPILSISSDNNKQENCKVIYDLFNVDLTSEPDIPLFENNSIHEITVKLLGSDIPEEFSFVYLISDYLIALMIIVCLCCPFILIVKIMKGDW